MIDKALSEAYRLNEKIPYIPGEDGKYSDAESIGWWTNGFWAGLMWQLWTETKNDMFRLAAEISESRLDDVLNVFGTSDHDIGFLCLHTSGASFRLTNDPCSKRRVLRAAALLAGRFNPDLGIIRAWDGQWMKGYDTAGGAIIDTMMNLPLLYLASDITNDPRFRSIAMRHADTMLQYMLRPDGSVNHQLVFDVNTGELIATPGGQGYESGSSWSRGQAWAVYGFALSYRHSGKQSYLDAAKRVASYFMANASLTGYVPLVDFRAPAEPVWYDTTAGAIAACGMLEIEEHVGEYEKPLYHDSAVKLIEAIDEKWCDYDTETDGIVDGGSVSYHAEKHHERIIYGDYFFTEAVMRLLGKGFLIW